MRQIKIIESITSRQEEALEKYLVEIGHYPLLTADKEVELAQTIRKGGVEGERAKRQLVNSNLRFVVSVAKQYQRYGLPLTDLINEGNIGLIRASERFDETRGFKFISYAIWWVRQSILQAISEYSNFVRRPMNQITVSNKIKNATNAFLQQHQRYPSAEELSEIISMEIDKIEKAIQSEIHVNSIDAPIIEDEGSTLADVLASSSNFAADRKVDHESMCCDLNQVLYAVLNERERNIVLQSFGIGCQERALDDIGGEMGLSRERVRQIREHSIEKIRKNNWSNMLLRHVG